MMVTIDKAGRVVIPKSIRDTLDLDPETPLTIDVEGDSIRLSRSREGQRRLVFADDGRPYFPADDETAISDLDVQRARDDQQR